MSTKQHGSTQTSHKHDDEAMERARSINVSAVLRALSTPEGRRVLMGRYRSIEGASAAVMGVSPWVQVIA
jgi:hypothetical protein